ncbi:MAG TPA: FAD-dependent oxidoreductase [Steroidobacteraceae bacterium]|nr:FAD-dependent oxidoreductase [Steroidobacteraceae bacterium]
MTDHPSQTIATRTVHRPPARALKTLSADICVLGAGISGVTAALEAAKLGRKVVIVDGAPALGGQAIGSIIGTLIGLYTHGKDAYQITHGVADDLIRDLTAEGSIHRLHHSTVVFQYDEVRLARWMERKVEEAGVRAVVGAVLTAVNFADRRVESIDFVTRFGPLRVAANGYVDSSGDATLSYEAGLDVREPEEPVYGTLNFLIEGYNVAHVGELVMKDVHAKLIAKCKDYGLVRHDGHLMHFPGKNFMLANIGHFETPLDPAETAHLVFEGRRQADNIIRFLRTEFPRIFENARVRTYGNPGIRQTRWIVSRKQLTVEDIRTTTRPRDAAARCAWWVELHGTKELVHWERFADGHVYYIPLGCMLPKHADNIVAAGRCVDADSHALSAIRVMGPCIAMGTAAAHALDLAGDRPVHDIDLAQFQERLRDNLERRD